ncbi:hypothetical protein [Streptomyces sp. NPDC001820]
MTLAKSNRSGLLGRRLIWTALFSLVKGGSVAAGAFIVKLFVEWGCPPIT